MCVQDNIALTYLHHLAECESAQKRKKKKKKHAEDQGDDCDFKLFCVKRTFVALIFFCITCVLNSELVLYFPLCSYTLCKEFT